MRSACALMPTEAALHRNLGTLLSDAGDDDQAQRELEKAVALAPSDPENHQSLARALVKQKRVTEALAEYSTAARLAPRSPGIQLEFGQLYAAMNDPAHATEQYRTCLQIDPQTPSAIWLWAPFVGAEDLAAAEAELSKALALIRNPAKRIAFGVDLAQAKQAARSGVGTEKGPACCLTMFRCIFHWHKPYRGRAGPKRQRSRFTRGRHRTASERCSAGHRRYQSSRRTTSERGRRVCRSQAPRSRQPCAARPVHALPLWPGISPAKQTSRSYCRIPNDARPPSRRCRHPVLPRPGFIRSQPVRRSCGRPASRSGN